MLSEPRFLFVRKARPTCVRCLSVLWGWGKGRDTVAEWVGAERGALGRRRGLGRRELESMARGPEKHSDSLDQKEKEDLPAMQKTWVQSLGQRREMATHASILAWRIPWTEGPRGLPCITSLTSQSPKKSRPTCESTKS